MIRHSRCVRLVPCALALATTLTLPALGARSGAAGAQEEGTVVAQGPGSANYELAARFAPYKVRELVHSTRVAQRWIEDTDRFWYQWESSEGTHYYLVDPGRGTRTEIFDNDRIAAELTRITRDPWDARHLPIRNIRFLSAGTLQFEVESSRDEEIEEDEEEDEEDVEDIEEEQEEEEQAPSRPRTRKKVHYFEYDVATRTLRELEDYEKPIAHPFWASVSPDTAWVVFSREFNLWMMSYEEYGKILEARRGKTGDEAEEAEEKVEVEEIQLTTDGRAALLVGLPGTGGERRGDRDTSTGWDSTDAASPSSTRATTITRARRTTTRPTSSTTTRVSTASRPRHSTTPSGARSWTSRRPTSRRWRPPATSTPSPTP